MTNAMPEPNVSTYAPLRYLCRKSLQALPTLDGRLDKPFWDAAEWSEDFVDIEGEAKPLPAKRTRFKMLWDDDCVYFGAELIEDEIWATLTERDSVIFHDNDFEIFIDPDGDTHQYYEFEMNALNTVWDLLLVKPYRDGGPCVNGWDIQEIRSAVHIEGRLNDPSADNRFWSIEAAMPWKALKECAPNGRPPLPGEFWRVNFSRVQWQVEVKDNKYVKKIDPRTGRPYPEDNWVWSPQGIINMHYPELWGYVFFADEAVGETPSIPEDERRKWELRRLYYRQRQFYSEHERYSSELADLQLTEWTEEPRIEVTSRTFLASVPGSDGKSRIYIQEEGKVWKELAKDE
ncbi:carbohydrate-binding family 9-like protein [Paenibacillus sp. LHD-117]|uniref:carbohydrate-binding family 9-like protein n=1 Tax=Paenibacillus sp. LHD-117 TaxID=3071412 RepID=UPI0027DFA019|nr:carbohydrate-binding family 9-like protein [Paenibacillus sp. LHD-117]MDQ6420018.1 carbohydrate-binding family 9-like protein [Paenibacillus sp. LHD-117]